jgi:hypothetical protein
MNPQNTYVNNLLARGNSMLSQNTAQPGIPYAGSNYANPSATNPTAPVVAPSTAPVDTSPFAAYRNYLSKYIGSVGTQDPAIDTARTGLADIQNQSEAKALQARRSYDTTIDTPGMLKGGAQTAAAEDLRLNNQELADLALRQSAQARTLDALTGNQTAKQDYLKTQADLSKPMQIGDKYFDPISGKEITGVKDSAGFSLSPGEARYDANGKLIASLAPKPDNLTASEKKDYSLGSYGSKFDAGGYLGDGQTPIHDAEGNLTAAAWKSAIADARTKGIPRADFIKQYGDYITNGNLGGYGLTKSEQRLVTGPISAADQALIDAMN